MMYDRFATQDQLVALAAVSTANSGQSAVVVNSLPGSSIGGGGGGGYVVIGGTNNGNGSVVNCNDEIVSLLSNHSSSLMNLKFRDPSSAPLRELGHDDENHDYRPGERLNNQYEKVFKFVFNTVDHGRIVLDSILQSGNLYLKAKANLQKISKEEFVNLLEFAEEDLNCDHIILCIPKKEPNLKVIIRTFMYFGFTLLDPNNPLLPADANSEDLYMATSCN